MTWSLRSTAATVLASARNVLASMPWVNCLIAVIASAISSKESDGSLKGKHSLVRGAMGDWLLQSVLWREIDGGAEEVGEAVLNAHHIEQGKTPRSIEFRDQIDVGRRRGRASGDGTVQAEMDNTGGFQLRFVFAQFCDHVVPVHTCNVPYSCAMGKRAGHEA
jgi:hypothetical protein